MTSSIASRGTCPVCGTSVTLVKTNRIRRHRHRLRDGSSGLCPGSGMRTEQHRLAKDTP